MWQHLADRYRVLAFLLLLPIVFFVLFRDLRRKWRHGSGTKISILLSVIAVFAVGVIGLLEKMIVHPDEPAASAFHPNDKPTLWDIKFWQGHSYALVGVMSYTFTGEPGGGVDVFRYPGKIDQVSDADFQEKYLLYSENLNDDFHQDAKGNWDIRYGVSGKINLHSKRIVIKFDRGRDQIFPLTAKNGPLAIENGRR